MTHDNTDGEPSFNKTIHDINNALAALMMRAELLAMYAEAEKVDTAFAKESADDIQRHIARLRALVEMLKDRRG